MRKPAITPGGPLGRAAVAVVLGALRLLPRSVREALARLGGALVWALGVRRRVALENLRLALPEKSEAERRAIARGAYRHMALAALEAVTSDLVSDEELNRAVEVVDWKGLEELMKARQPVLVASAHLGSWEFFAEVMARRGYVFSAVVRPLAGAFNEWVVKNRARSGVELILQRGAITGMLRGLKQGRTVVQLIDQSLPARDGVFVPFFGRAASTTPAISMAALRSKAPVYVVVATREGGRLRMHVDGPVPLPQLADRRAALTAHTAALTAILEGHIRRVPEQWLWLHRRWKVAPPSEADAQQGPEL